MKVTLSTVVRTLLSRFFLVLLMIVGFVPGLIMLMLPKKWLYNSRFFAWSTYLFYRAMLWGTFLPITYVGKENLSGEPVIFAGNHQSSLDIPLLGVLTQGMSHVWLAKHELMASPILRFILPRMAVLVDMSTPLKGMRSLVQAVNLVYGKQRHLMIFPEGGRYTDGTVHDFYAGFVILAKKTGRPVVPVRIFNVHKAYPPGTFWVQSHPIKVVIGTPMHLHDDETNEAFRDRVYQWFVQQTGD